MKILKLISTTLYWLTILVLFFVITATTLTVFTAPGGFRLFIVQSGSMEPVLQAGSVVLIKPQKEYHPGEIVTFSPAPGSLKNTVTHRITALEWQGLEKVFITQGDANQAPDQQKVSLNSILGKVVFALPYIGSLVAFAKTRLGFLLFILLPGLIVIFAEILNIRKEILKIIRQPKAGPQKIPAKEILLKIAFLFLLLNFSFGFTQARFSDQEQTSATLSIGFWQEPQLFCQFDEETNEFLFQIENLGSLYQKLSYELTYFSGQDKQGIKGEVLLEDGFFFRRLFLGICSDSVCSPHQDLSKLKFKATLEGEGNGKKHLKCRLF